MEHKTNLSSAKLMSAQEIQSDAHSQSPLYQKIYLVIRDRILSGEYPDQSLLPSEHELAELFGVSRITAKRALNEISAEGLCDRKRGRGSRVTYKPATTPLKTDVQGLLDYLFQMNLATEGFVLKFEYVAAPFSAKRALNEISAEGLCDRKRGRGSRVTYKPATTPLKTDVQGLLDYLFQMNLATEGFVLKFEYVAATAEIATVMKIEEGTEIQHSVRVRHQDGTPFSYLTTYVPGDLGRLYTHKHLASQAVLTVLEKTGVEVAHAEQTITATLAGARAAESLQVKLGSPLLRISRIVFDRNEKVVEHIIGLYRPDQYQYRTLLSRVSTGDETTWSESK